MGGELSEEGLGGGAAEGGRVEGVDEEGDRVGGWVGG